MQDILLSDIEVIKKGKSTFNSDLICYGEIWANFLSALEKEGCSYWGNLYKNIFENSFEIDEEALERRINVPKGIQEQGAVAVANYLKELEKGEKHLNEARIIILGEKGAGKTCLARRLINPNAPMTTDEESTAGVDTTLWKPELDNINIHIWDFAGHTVTHAVHKFFLSERCLYVLVYDGRTEERNRVEYWLNQIKNYGGDSKVFILVNKRDSHTPEISQNSLKEEYPFIIGFYFFSIKDDNDQLENFRAKLTEYIKNNPSWSTLMIPTNYFNVKKELEQHFVGNKKNDYINITEFNRIAKRNEITEYEELLKNLHALGICLRYENMGIFDTLVLNPEWISQGIYKIINWVHEQGKHLINKTDFSIVFKNEAIRYPYDKRNFIFELMKHYELAYETKNKDFLIIPHLLHKDQPNILPNFPAGESLMLRYKAEQPLPPDTISRFIVRHNEEIKREGNDFLVWRYGVVLKAENGSIALVRELKQERMITVSVRDGDKATYMDKLRETLNEIFNSYKSKEPKLQYKIEIADKKEKNDDLWLEDTTIYNHYFYNRPYYYDRFNRDLTMKIPIHVFRIAPQKMMREAQTVIFNNCTFNNADNFINDMRNITQSGDGAQYNEKPDGVTQNNYFAERISKFPATINEEEWKQFVNFLNLFISSKESRKLSLDDHDSLRNEIRKVEKENKISGWNRVREYLADTANITTIGAPLLAFISANGDNITKWIMDLFK